MCSTPVLNHKPNSFIILAKNLRQNIQIMLRMKNFLLITTLLFLFAFKHPLYLGVTELKYNAKEKALQGSVKLFTNDLEDALKRIHGETVDLINIKDTLKTKKLLNDYLKKRLSFAVNGFPKKYEFLGFENEQEATWLYIELRNCPLPKKLTIENKLLYDFIKEQVNIIHLEVGVQKKSIKLANPETDTELTFP